MLTLLFALAQAASSSPAADIARGLSAVGERPSAEPAIRAEAPSGAPSVGFALGAYFAAWRNAAAAVAYDSAHSTGDGGDAEVLAEDCSDERIAFLALEARRAAAGMSPAAIATAADPARAAAAITAWRARPASGPAQCR